MRRKKPDFWGFVSNAFWGLGIAVQSLIVTIFIFLIIALIKMGIQALF